MLRLLVIAFAVLGVLAHAAWARFSRSARGTLPRHLRQTLERFGPPFVKLGQALSLRRDLLPDDIIATLQGLQIETDLHQEALNVRRFVKGFREQPLAYVPDVEIALCTEGMLVQEFSHGRRIDDPVLHEQGPRLARALVDLYLHQFFVMGVFHGDPHPGNLFVREDGRLCFHDFGVVGVLSPTLDRRVARESIGAILADYSGRPLSEWSLGEVLVRMMRLGRGMGLALPTNLAILARTAALIEQVLPSLDRELTVIEALTHADPELLRRLFVARPEPAGLLRLKSETAITAQNLPSLIAEWLHRAQQNGGGIPVSIRIEALHASSTRIGRGTDRIVRGIAAAERNARVLGAGPHE